MCPKVKDLFSLHVNEMSEKISLKVSIISVASLIMGENIV